MKAKKLITTLLLTNLLILTMSIEGNQPIHPINPTDLFPPSITVYDCRSIY